MLVVSGIAQVSALQFDAADDIGISELRARLLFFGQALSPTLGALLLLAAVASLALRHRLLATVTFAAAVLVTVAVALGAVNDAGIGRASAAMRAGAVLSLLATMPLSLAAAWLARSAQAVADPPREPPDGGLGGGDGVGEAELHGLG
jgi:hypothetical protein